MDYDFIITGGGCAGLSLATRMILSGKLTGKKILLVDREEKRKNDRTWCFWEKDPGLFESIVFKSWNQLNFHGEAFTQLLDIHPYRYKLIRGIDFYRYCHEIIRESKVEVVTGNVTELISGRETASLNVDGKKLEASFIFNSIVQPFNSDSNNKYHHLRQHFKGWFIRTEASTFDPGKPTLMDFRVDQQHGTTFVYVLPFNEHEALVEYTLFTEDLLKDQDYDVALEAYMNQFLPGNYSITEEEFGIIPMTNFPFSFNEGRIVNIGTAGGATKPSTGYTFQFIQKSTQAIVSRLAENSLRPTWSGIPSNRKFSFYDSVLLRILKEKKIQGKTLFTDLFKNGDPQTVLKFLDNETTFTEDISIMKRLPLMPFAKAALKEWRL